MFDLNNIRKADPEIANAIDLEVNRQRNKIELIASENFVSPAVIEAMGTPLTNKYAEGYPGKRYYGGCEYVDIVEDLARERAKELFGAEFANVQPHSGASANLAVFFATMEPGDTYLGMNLAHGGHLSHGSPVNISGKYFNVVPYGVDDVTHRIDYDALHKLAVENNPKLILAGASAYAREIDFAKFREIADEVDTPVAYLEEALAPLLAAAIEPSVAETGHHLVDDVEGYVTAVLVVLREIATVETCPHTVVGESAYVAVKSFRVVIEYGLALRHLFQRIVHALLQPGTHILILGGSVGQGKGREVVPAYMSVEAETARAPVGEVGVLGLPSADACLAEVGREQAVNVVLEECLVVEVEGSLEHAVGEGYLLEIE